MGRVWEDSCTTDLYYIMYNVQFLGIILPQILWSSIHDWRDLFSKFHLHCSQNEHSNIEGTVSCTGQAAGVARQGAGLG